MSFMRHASWLTAAIGLFCSLSLLAPPTFADISADQVDTLSVSGVPVLVPDAGQPLSDQVPTLVQADSSGFRIEYGSAPTFAITGSAVDSRLLVPPYVCGDETTAYCTDVALTTSDGEQVGDEVFRGLLVGDATAAVEHFSCCNGRGWRLEWTVPTGDAWYSVVWKGEVPFAPAETPNFDPNNSQYAQALANIAAGLVPLSPPTSPQSAPELPAPVTNAPSAPSNQQPSSLCGAPANPWGYNFCGSGVPVRTPDSNLCAYFNCIPSFWKQTNGYVAQCLDGAFSHSGGVRGACSGHGGVARTLYEP